MIIDPKQQSKKDNYKLLIGSVLPRPIAFVTSLGPNGTLNAAPFSFFNVVGTQPPLLAFSCIRKPGGVMKDTARNILEHGEFVVHVVDGNNVAMVNDTSIDFPPEESEAEAVGFTPVPSEAVKVPGLKEAKIRMECRLYRHFVLGGTDEEPDCDHLIGEVVLFHIDDALCDGGRIDTVALDPVGRLAGTTYVRLGEMFSMPRLSYGEWREKTNGA
ncbi:flavin reductase family protein [Staphylospora marina]|uniref:flavin reductase family protein n=1 Tax=Staphylospora marina TaxID=2490858 RepID=UPI000F5BD41B|nr:flavin reductase family protein [Staphylospora marina]